MLRTAPGIEDAVLPAAAPSLPARRPRAFVGVTLWPDQDEAVDKATAALNTAPQVVVLMACGSGKTVVAGAIAQEVLPRTGSVLIAVPTLDLVSQTLDQWAGAFGPDALGEVIVICSDRRVLGDASASRGARVVSDPRELGDLRATGRRITVVCTYQSLHIVIAAHQSGAGAWDLVIADELHRSDSNTWARIHNDGLVPARLRVSLTATLRDLVGTDGIPVRPDRFGPVVHRLSVGEAIERGRLADYELVIADASARAVADLVRQGTFLTVGPMHVEAGVVAKAVAVLRAAAERGSRRMITYHSTVAAARAFAQLLQHLVAHLPPEHRPASLWTGHVHGRQDRAVRRRILDRFRSSTEGLAVLTNSRLLIEGFDCPETDAVAIVDPRRSKIEVTQIAGRALRRGDRSREKVAAIIVPAITAANAVEESGFDTVLATVEAMAAMDERLYRHLTRMRRARDRPDRPAQPLGLPKWISFSGVGEISAGFIEAITTRAVLSTGSRRERHLADLRAFRAGAGHLRVARDWIGPSGERTGQWLNNAKYRYRQNSLPASVVCRLEDLGVVWHTGDAEWKQFLQDLTDYKAAHGNLLVPSRYVTPDGRPLGSQVRVRRRRGDFLSADQRRELDALGFVADVAEERFLGNIELLREFVAENGHARVPPSDQGGDRDRLGNWLKNCRKNARQGRLPLWQHTELTACGVELPPHPDSTTDPQHEERRHLHRRAGEAPHLRPPAPQSGLHRPGGVKTQEDRGQPVVVTGSKAESEGGKNE
ncbi:Helicase associated domain protein [Kitasatospora sp. A2-31]|uniref:Helicase associated domain protein n=1 Tax=Kitasatospora sp. A2-31 TaxID=2916414 RepID=UPI001EECF239|nr:Helicase associated domain protein [Kitasatospora sp. A2-31]MCG6496896.1 Helicase associated domain protein [Kitasatospora sp. A2-31]